MDCISHTKVVDIMLEVVLRTLYNIVLLSDKVLIDYMDYTDDSCPYGYDTSMEFRKYWSDEKQCYFYRQYIWKNDEWIKRMTLSAYELELFIVNFTDPNSEEYEQFDDIDIMFYKYDDIYDEKLVLIGQKDSYNEKFYI